MTTRSFYLPVRVYYEDTDAGGIVYHSNYLKYAERARTELLRQVGNGRSTQLDNGFAFVITDANIRFKSPSRLDDLLHVSVAVSSMKGTRIVFRQTVTNAGSGAVCAELDVTVCIVTLPDIRPVKIPASVIENLTPYVTEQRSD